jgi:hypothetical protein
MNNTKQWSSATPGYIIFLVDQSGSMSEAYPQNENKAKFAAVVINRTIKELIFINSAGEIIKDRVFISIIGYGGSGGSSVDEIRSDYLSKFADNPIRIETGKQKQSDNNGGLIEIDVQNPIFIEPIANGLTPMGTAFETAKKLIESWVQSKPDNPAPVVINISDGMPYPDGEDTKATRIAKEIMSISTNDGNPLVFNAHIGDSTNKCICSAAINELPDEQAKFLFEISSTIPESYKEAAKKQELSVQNNSRGFVSNADPETFIKFINFGSAGGSDRR